MNKPAVETDVVVIGSGCSGLTAAVTTAQGGARVILFEKQQVLGGTSNFFYGTFAVESEMQRARYIMYTRDQAFKNIMEYSHWKANPRLVRAYVDESAGTISWLQKQGVEFIDAKRFIPDGPPTYHVVKGKGQALVKALATVAREEGAEIKLSTSVKKILRSGDAITGIIAEKDGEELQVNARAVYVASGGYANNKEWIKKYNGFDLGVNLLTVGNVDKMGDGIRMAWEVGAAEYGLDSLELIRVAPAGPEFTLMGPIEFATMQPDLWVDKFGERFCDEGIAFDDTHIGNVNARYKEGYTFNIFDTSIIGRLLDRGIDRNLGIENPPGTKPVGIVEAIKVAIDKKTQEVFEADSVEELAGKMGVNPKSLKYTVDEYNGFCEKGHDDLFAKDRKYLWALRGPKYYAVRARTVSLGSMGGIKINQRTEVVDKQDKTIPGLYAGGYDAGGMFGDSYPIKVASGSSSGFAINSGRLAGKNILKYIGK